MKEITGLYYHAEERASVESQRAQRMAELEQIAKYRAIKLQQYKDWSDPVKQAAMKAEYKRNEEEGKKILPTLSDQPWVRTGRAIDIKPLFKIQTFERKMTMWEKIKAWLRSVTF